jgi:hypothetical protein
LQFASEKLTKNENFVLLAVRKNYEALPFVSTIV